MSGDEALRVAWEAASERADRAAQLSGRISRFFSLALLLSVLLCLAQGATYFWPAHGLPLRYALDGASVMSVLYAFGAGWLLLGRGGAPRS